MKTSLKVAAAVATTLLGAGVANAASIVPSTGDGSLMFFLTDTKTNQTYTDVLTQDVNGYFSAAQAKTPAPTAGVINTINGDAGFQINLSTDTNLTSFLTAAGSDTLSYGIMAGAYSGALGSKQRPIGAARYIASTSSPQFVPTVSQGQIVNAIASGLNSDIGTLNTNLGSGNSTTQGVFGTSSSVNGTALDLYGAGLPVGTAVGQSAGLYGVTGNGTASGAGFGYSLGSVIFAADTLTFTGNTAAVPLPAAVWLLGSGLLGLLGVSRRRNAEAA